MSFASFASRDGDAPAEHALSLASVLEEEYAALHPLERLDILRARSGFTAGDVADLPGFARALLDAQDLCDAPGVVWEHWPSAPATAPISPRRIDEVVVRDQSLLVARLRAVLARDPGANAADDARVRELLAERLTALLSTELEREPAFVPLFETLHARDNGTFGVRPLLQRNRLVLETAFAPFLATTEQRRLESIIQRIHTQRHSALCLSGGGIRSASFAMGVVQGLARRGLLPRFHYMSTVSGGGYTGSWLSAWMARAGAESVHEQLRPSQSARPGVEPAPVRHIRSYSAYLNPALGLLSADTWTLLATIARNILLIWLVTLPVLAAALMLPRLLVSGPMTTFRDWSSVGIDSADIMLVLAIVGTVLSIAAIAFVQRHLYTYSGREDHYCDHDPVTLEQFLTRCLAPLVVAMVALAQTWEMIWTFLRFSHSKGATLAIPLSHRPWVVGLVGIKAETFHAFAASVFMGVEFWVFVYVTAWAISARGRRFRPAAALLSAVSGALAGTIGGVAAAQLFGVTVWHHPPEFYATFAVPMSLLGLLVSKQLVVGLASHQMTDAERESNARFSAWLLIAIIAWIAIVGIALYGPDLLLQSGAAATRIKQLIGVGGVTGVATALLAGSSRQAMPGASPKGGASATGGIMGTAQRLAVGLAAPLFAVTVIVLVSLLDGSILGAACRLLPGWCPQDTPDAAAELFLRHAHPLALGDNAMPQLVLLVLALLLLIGYGLARLIDTNRFSLHAMYRVRLVRTFLGASRPPGERQPNPFTGFDETDDMRMGDLWPARRVVGDSARMSSPDELTPPLHIVNLTLNMVAGTNLATQGRKATAFTVTPLHAGCATVGYRRTSAPDGAPSSLYGGAGGISLGTAMAVSGAAASPNAGYHSSPAVTFLMTLFNARLGWWLGNPGPAGNRSYRDDEPRLALLPILEEMFGRTTDRSPYVYLSDGGHFENLGLYEMVRRRCRFIVVSDAGCDPGATFDDLGGAIRKIRIDFGVSIEFDSGIPIYPRSVENRPAGARYWAVARILYSRVDGEGASDGVLLYIKPAFYGLEGREPCDVYNYGTSTAAFPHESTSNQFFGEAQFESYRALGDYAVDCMCESEFGVAAGSDGVVSAERLEEWLGDVQHVLPVSADA